MAAATRADSPRTATLHARLLGLLRRRRALQTALAAAQAAQALAGGPLPHGPTRALLLNAPAHETAAARAALTAHVAAARSALARQRVAVARAAPPAAAPLARRERLLRRAERLLRGGEHEPTAGEMSVVAGDGFAPAALRGMIGSRTAALRRAARG